MRSDVAIDDSAASAPEDQKRGGRREILLRVISAIVLAPLGLWACWTGGLPLAIATGACAVMASFEWTRMASQTDVRWARVLLYIAMAATAAGAVYVAPAGIELVALAALAGCAIATAIAWLGKGSISSMAFGAIYTSLPFGAFVWIRAREEPSGQIMLMALLAIVWTTDIAAYFAGRGFGGPLLSRQGQPQQDMDRRYRRAGMRSPCRRRCRAGSRRRLHALGICQPRPVYRGAGWRSPGVALQAALRGQGYFRASCPAMAACSTGSTP